MSLITTDDELRRVTADFARRRVGFSERRLAESGLEATLDTIRGLSAADWKASGVNPTVYGTLRHAGFSDAELHRVLAHPDAIADSPDNLVYYRRLLSMSNKVFGRLFPQLARRVGRGPAPLEGQQLEELAELNEMLSNVANRAGLAPDDPERLVVLSEGASIDGDWRNQVGRIATWRAFEAIERCLAPEGPRTATAKRRGHSQSLLGLTDTERTLLVDDGWKPDIIEVGDARIRFGSQRVGATMVKADITVSRLAEGAPAVIEAAGEVKGSTDPANAMERWRLASGNIEAMNRIRSGAARRRPTTFYVGLVITEAVVDGDGQTPGMRELLDNTTLDAAFSVVKLGEASEQQRFCEFFLPQLGLEPLRA